jgi:hypothetical protein
MEVYIKRGYVERRAQIGKWASLLGLVVLGGGFLISLRNPGLFIISFGTLILGFLLSNVGIYYANRYARPDRPDVVLAQALKGFDKRYALYQFLFPVSHVLREPSGLTVLIPKPQEGRIVYSDGKWRSKQGWSRLLRWVGQEGLGKPEAEAQTEAVTMHDWLQRQAPELDVPVRGLVIFTHPKAELDLDNPPVTVLAPKQLKGWLRKAGKLTPLSQEAQTQLAEVMNQAAQGGSARVEDDEE